VNGKITPGDLMMKIEKNIEIPSPQHAGNNKKRDNIRKTILLMKVGDSVAFSDRGEVVRFRARAYTMSKTQELTAKWLTRKMHDSEPMAWRVWRVE
jgi:hypothetical protein